MSCTRIHHRLCPAILAIAVIAGCAQREREEPVVTAAKVAPAADLAAEYNFAPSDAQSLYQLLSQREAKIGEKIGKASHQAQALIACRKSGALRRCSYRVRLPQGGGLTATEVLPTPFQAAMWDFIVTRGISELADGEVAFSDLSCYFQNQDAPPYRKGYSCRLDKVRRQDEVVLASSLSERLSDLLQGNRPYEEPRHLARGSLLCYWEERPRCLLRAGWDTSRHIEVDDARSGELADVLLGALRDYTHDRGPGLKAMERPDELLTTIACETKSAAAATTGRRDHLCRVSF